MIHWRGAHSTREPPNTKHVGKKPRLQPIERRFELHCLRGFYGMGPSLQNTSVASEHHGKNNVGPNLWIHFSLLNKRSRISAQVIRKQMAKVD